MKNKFLIELEISKSMIYLYLEALTCRIAAVCAHAFPMTLPVRSLLGRTGSVDPGEDRGAVDANVRVWSSKPEARPKVCPFSPAGLRHSQDSQVPLPPFASPAKMTAEAEAAPAAVPESLLKKRKRDEQWASAKSEIEAAAKSRNSKNRTIIFKRAEQYKEEYEKEVSSNEWNV